MTAGVAKLIFEKREDIEWVFAEHDMILARSPSSDGPRLPALVALAWHDRARHAGCWPEQIAQQMGHV